MVDKFWCALRNNFSPHAARVPAPLLVTGITSSQHVKSLQVPLGPRFCGLALLRPKSFSFFAKSWQGKRSFDHRKLGHLKGSPPSSPWVLFLLQWESARIPSKPGAAFCSCFCLTLAIFMHGHAFQMCNAACLRALEVAGSCQCQSIWGYSSVRESEV